MVLFSLSVRRLSFHEALWPVAVPSEPDIRILSAVFTIRDPNFNSTGYLRVRLIDILVRCLICPLCNEKGSPNLSYQAHITNIPIGGTHMSGKLGSATKQNFKLIFSCRYYSSRMILLACFVWLEAVRIYSQHYKKRRVRSV